MKSLLKCVVMVITLAPAIYFFGHVYIYTSQTGAGSWYGPLVDGHSSLTMAIGASGLVMSFLATVALAPLLAISALDPRASRALLERNQLRWLEGVVLGLDQTPVGFTSRKRVAEQTSSHGLNWATFLFALPALVAVLLMAVAELPMARVQAISALVGLSTLAWMVNRLRRGGYPAPSFDVLLVGAGQLHATMLGCYLYLSANDFLFPYLEFGWC